jgi:delta-like protein
MCPRQTALFAVTWTLYFISSGIPQAHATGLFELQIRAFRNDLGLTSNGTCCNGFRQNGICSAPCRTFFKVCLAHFQADIASNPQPRCTFANFTTPVLGDNSMDFSILSDLPVQGSRQNTFYFPVTEFSWPGDFSLIIEAWHNTSLDSPNQEYRNILIARLAEIRSAPSGTSWYVLEHSFNYIVLNYAFRFTCDSNYYGPKCGEHCRPRDDTFGHYTCSNNGTKVCMNGWDGQYCDVALCLPGCHQNNGLCDEPNECK